MSDSVLSLLDIQVATRARVNDIEDQNDLINLSLSVITVHLAKLLPVLTKFSIGKSKKPKTEAILKDLGMVLEYTFILCNACDFDIPSDEELLAFEEAVPYEVRHDAVLTVAGMINAISDLYYLFYVETDLMPWENEEVKTDLAEIVSTVIVGMKHLGDKFGFTPEDVVCQFS